MSSLKTDHVVIAGAGYAGLPCALKLASLRKKNSRFRLTLLSREARQELTCELYRTLRWGDSVLLPFRDLLKNLNVQFEEARLLNIDPFKRELELKGSDRKSLKYDHLILALGRKSTQPSIEGFQELAEQSDRQDPNIFFFRSEAQVQALRLALRKRRWEDPLPKERDQFVVVLGAGSTGIEVAGELAAMRGKNPQARVILLDEKPELLTDFSPVARKILKKQLQKLQIESVLGSRASKITNKELFLENGQVIPWDLLVLCTGGKAQNSLLKSFEASLDPDGGLKVNGHFQVQNFHNVYALGDMARIPYPSEALQNLRFVPQRAQFAIQEGIFLAESLNSYIHSGKFPREVFDPQDKGYLISLGPQRGLGRLGPEIPGKFKKLLSPFIYGPAVGELKRAAHLKYMATLKSLKIRAQFSPSSILNNFLSKT